MGRERTLRQVETDALVHRAVQLQAKIEQWMAEIEFEDEAVYTIAANLEACAKATMELHSLEQELHRRDPRQWPRATYGDSPS